jgi:hypothetical protein
LILDGTVVRVRLDRKATAIVLLVVLGVREDGQKVLLAVKNMGIDAVPPPESSDRLPTTRGRGGAAAWGISVRSCGLACEQFPLLGPVQRQIEFGQPRRGERDDRRYPAT